MSFAWAKWCVSAPLVFTALVGSCAVESEGDSVAANSVFRVAEARYETTWALGDAVLLDDGGWQMTTDLGYTVRVKHGYLVAYRASLVGCAAEAESATARVKRFFSPRAARAGHAEELDPSATRKPQVEWLTKPGRVSLGTVVFDPGDYCSLHYLVARGDTGTYALPSDVGMIGRSLYLTGTYVAPGSDAEVPFLVDTSEGTGVLTTVAASGAGDTRTAHGVALVTIERRLDTLMDGIDLASNSNAEVAHAVLGNLAQDTRIVIDVVSSDDLDKE